MKINPLLGKKLLRTGGNLLYKIFRYVLLIGCCYVVLYPVIKMLFAALSDPYELMQGESGIIPNEPTFTNFKNMQKFFPYLKHLVPTVQIAGICTLLQLISCSLVGYGLGRYKFKGNTLVFVAAVFTFILPQQISLIPAYHNYRFFDLFGIGKLVGLFTGKDLTVNLLPKFFAMYIPAVFGVGLKSGIFIFLFKQYFESMPKDLEEAAKLDGCNPFTTFLRVMVPNIKPVFVSVALLSVIFYWNDTMVTDVMTGMDGKFTLMGQLQQVRILDFASSQLSQARIIAERYAMMVSTVAPLMIIFIICQKFFVESMDRSGSKG